MKIISAQFLRGVVKPDELLENGTPQVALIGRSNVGKSSVINSLTGEKGLARTSAHPGRTREINVFGINGNKLYLVDLPGYGFARASRAGKAVLHDLIAWYFFRSGYEQKRVVLIVDANVGITANDVDMLSALAEHEKNVIIVANKIDKLKKTEVKKRIAEIQAKAGKCKVIPYSAQERVGVKELTDEIFN
jgi:GTP-binding protein